MQPEVPINNSAPRKQNIACDACRTRKVKCVIISGQDKCQHCQTKTYPCTFNVQRETSEKKRQGNVRRRNSESTPHISHRRSWDPPHNFSTGAIQTSSAFSSLSSSTSPPPIQQPFPSSDTGQSSLTSFYPNTFQPVSSRSQVQTHPMHQPLRPSPVAHQPGPSFITSSLSHSPSPAPSAYSETPTSRLLAYLFSPEGASPLFPKPYNGYRVLPDYQQRLPFRSDDWGEVGLKLQDPAFRIEFALDLVEVYFEICHTRVALLSPARFRAQLHASLPPVSGSHHSPGSPHVSLPASSASSPLTPKSLHHTHSQLHQHQQAKSYNHPTVHPAVLATVLAWGGKFSEHPLIVLDRSVDRARRSRLAKSLIRKAWEVAEAEKMHTVPSADAVIVCLLLDGLHSHDARDPEGYRGFWLNCCLRHLLHLQSTLQINNRSAVPGLIEPGRRNTMVYAWWMACLADAYSALYFRRKPVLEDNDYNIDFYPQDISQIAQAETEGTGSEKELSVVKRPEFLNLPSLTDMQIWYTASHAMARCAREMSRKLWRPIIHAEGIPFDVLCALISQFDTWRSEYLDKVGVPGSQVNWDFLAAVAACGQDATYHVMWVILYQALREFGLREIKQIEQSGNNLGSHPLAAQFVATQAQVQKEALNAASRIAGLTNLLTQSSYLRLDPNVMHYSIYAAGKLLAEFGREEVEMCIRGLQQYGISYDDAFDQATEIQTMYASRREQEPAPQAWEGVNDTETHHNTYSLPDGASYALTKLASGHHNTA